MEMNIQIQRAAEALNQGDGPCVSRRFCTTGFSGQVHSNGAVDNTQRLTHRIANGSRHWSAGIVS
jgi:hypothetical protein